MKLKYFTTILWAVCALGYEATLVPPPDPKTVIPNRYVVKLRSDCTLEQHFKNIGVSGTETYFNNVTDLVDIAEIYSGYFLSEQLQKIRSDTCVEAVVPDEVYLPNVPKLKVAPGGPAYESGEEGNPVEGADSADNDENSSDNERSDAGSVNEMWKAIHRRQVSRSWKRKRQIRAPWHLRMISVDKKKEIPRSRWRLQSYFHVEEPGKGVDIYIAEDLQTELDRGIFGNRALMLPGVPARDPSTFWGGEEHGMHALMVTALAAGENYGLATSANIVGVTWISFSDFVSRLQDILQRHKERLNDPQRFPGWAGSVISLTKTSESRNTNWWIWGAVQRASKRLDDAGILIVNAAGNDRDEPDGLGVHGDNFPSGPVETCSLPRFMCVGAINSNWELAEDFSNRGNAVHIYAPGVLVPTLNTTGKTGLVNGTSMAAPQVVGFAAIVLSFEARHFTSIANDTFTLRNIIMSNALHDSLTGLNQRSRNVILNTGINLPSAAGALRPYLGPNTYQLNLLEDRLQPLRPTEKSVLSGLSSRPKCYDADAPERVSWPDAEGVNLRVSWERGHSNIYSGVALADELVVPCVNNACVYWRPINKFQSDLRVDSATILAKYTLHILNACKLDGPQGSGVESQTTGGTMIIPSLFAHITLRTRYQP